MLGSDGARLVACLRLGSGERVEKRKSYPPAWQRQGVEQHRVTRRDTSRSFFYVVPTVPLGPGSLRYTSTTGCEVLPGKLQFDRYRTQTNYTVPATFGYYPHNIVILPHSDTLRVSVLWTRPPPPPVSSIDGTCHIWTSLLIDCFLTGLEFMISFGTEDPWSSLLVCIRVRDDKRCSSTSDHNCY